MYEEGIHYEITGLNTPTSSDLNFYYEYNYQLEMENQGLKRGRVVVPCTPLKRKPTHLLLFPPNDSVIIPETPVKRLKMDRKCFYIEEKLKEIEDKINNIRWALGKLFD